MQSRDIARHIFALRQLRVEGRRGHKQFCKLTRAPCQSRLSDGRHAKRIIANYRRIERQDRKFFMSIEHRAICWWKEDGGVRVRSRGWNGEWTIGSDRPSDSCEWMLGHGDITRGRRGNRHSSCQAKQKILNSIYGIVDEQFILPSAVLRIHHRLRNAQSRLRIMESQSCI